MFYLYAPLPPSLSPWTRHSSPLVISRTAGSSLLSFSTVALLGFFFSSSSLIWYFDLGGGGGGGGSPCKQLLKQGHHTHTHTRESPSSPPALGGEKPYVSKTLLMALHRMNAECVMQIFATVERAWERPKTWCWIWRSQWESSSEIWPRLCLGWSTKFHLRYRLVFCDTQIAFGAKGQKVHDLLNS